MVVNVTSVYAPAVVGIDVLNKKIIQPISLRLNMWKHYLTFDIFTSH